LDKPADLSCSTPRDRSRAQEGVGIDEKVAVEEEKKRKVHKGQAGQHPVSSAARKMPYVVKDAFHCWTGAGA